MTQEGMDKVQEKEKYRSEEPFCGGRWVDRRLWRNPQKNLRDLSCTVRQADGIVRTK